MHMKIQLTISILWVWHLKIDPKSKNWSESIKNYIKTGITLAWNEQQPKLFHQQPYLNK